MSAFEFELIQAVDTLEARAHSWVSLVSNHAFVQWLFPIREQGVNWQSQPLQQHEIATIKGDEHAMSRLKKRWGTSQRCGPTRRDARSSILMTAVF